MRALGYAGNRLFRHDCRIAINTTRATFTGWPDRLIAGTMLFVALALVRAWFMDRPWTIAAWPALAAGIMAGAGAGRLVATRLTFHGFDGVLAADALHPLTRRQYQMIWHGIGIAMLGMGTLIARPSLLIVSLPAYLMGVLAAWLGDGFRVPGIGTRKFRVGREARAWLRRPSAGIALVMILLLSLLPARALDASALMAIVGVETVLLTLSLSIIDDDVVRFMAIAGHGSGQIVAHHGKSTLSFMAVAVPGCWIALGPVAASIVAATALAMLLILTLRVLAYRFHGKRSADLLVSIVAGLLALMAWSMPVALPIFAIAIIWHFLRRGNAKTWLLA